jgi:hypothetical protein
MMEENESIDLNPELAAPGAGSAGSPIPAINSLDQLRLHLDVWRNICDNALLYIPQCYKEINSKPVSYDAVSLSDLKIIATEFELARNLAALEDKSQAESFSSMNANLMEHLFLGGDLNDVLFFSNDGGQHQKYSADQKTNHAILQLYKSYGVLEDDDSKALYTQLFYLIRELDTKDFSAFYKAGSTKIEDINFDSKENIIRFKRIFLKRKSLFLAGFEALVFTNGEAEISPVVKRLEEDLGNEFFNDLKQYLLQQEDFALFVLQDKAEAFVHKKSNKLRLAAPTLKATPVRKAGNSTDYGEFKQFKTELEEVNTQLDTQIKSLRNAKDVDDDFINQYNKLNTERSILNHIVSEKQKSLTTFGKIKNGISDYPGTVKGHAGSTALAGAKGLMMQTGAYMGRALYNKFKGEDYKNDWEEITKKFSLDLAEVGGGMLLSLLIGPAGFSVVSNVFGMFKEKVPTQMDRMESKLAEISNKLDEIAKNINGLNVTLAESVVQKAKIETAKKALKEMGNHLTNIKNIYANIFRSGDYSLDVIKLKSEHDAFRNQFQLFMKEFWDQKYAFTTGAGFVLESESRDTTSLSYSIIETYKEKSTYLRFDQAFKPLSELINAVEGLITQYRDVRADLVSLMSVYLPFFGSGSQNKSDVLAAMLDLKKNEDDLNAVLMLSLITLRKNVLGERNQRLYDTMKTCQDNPERLDYFKAFYLKDKAGTSFYKYNYGNGNFEPTQHAYRFFMIPDAGKGKENLKYTLVNAQKESCRQTFESRIAIGHNDTLMVDDSREASVAFADEIAETIEYWIKKQGGTRRFTESSTSFFLETGNNEASRQVRFYVEKGKYGLEEFAWGGYELISGDIADFKGKQPYAIAGFDQKTGDFYIGFGAGEKDEKGNETIKPVNVIKFDQNARIRTEGNPSAYDYRFSNDAVKNRFASLYARNNNEFFKQMSSVRFDNLNLLVRKDSMLRGQTLLQGDAIIGRNHAYLVFQLDGNLVLYNGTHVWFKSETNTSDKVVLQFQTDGNLVIYPENPGQQNHDNSKWSLRKTHILEDYKKVYRMAVSEGLKNLTFFDKDEKFAYKLPPK